jgi:hypothetical protein
MKSILLWFPKEQINAFYLRLEEVLERLDRKDIHAVTGGSNDGFLDARLWIVSRGREYYEAMLADPSKGEDAEDKDNFEFCLSAMDAYEALCGEGAWESVGEKHWNAYIKAWGREYSGWSMRVTDRKIVRSTRSEGRER